jgi:hypothetical protein
MALKLNHSGGIDPAQTSHPTDPGPSITGSFLESGN